MIPIFDLDGTLANIDHRRHFVENKPKNWKSFSEACINDKPNTPIIQIYRSLRFYGNKTYIFSGRSEEVKYHTILWLKENNIFYDALEMRALKDYRDDRVVKKEMFLKLISDLEKANNDKISFSNCIVFDDRQKVVDMWREMGLTCCQVAPGNF